MCEPFATPLLTSDQIRDLDFCSKSFDVTGHTEIENGYALMKEAGEALFARIKYYYANKKVAFFIGPGNNGGDGLVAAKLCVEKGVPCVVYSMVPSDRFKNEALLAYRDFELDGGKVASIDHLQKFQSQLEADLEGELPYSLVVDCLLGNGCKGELRPAFASVVNVINCMKDKGATVIAADVPTGFDMTNESGTCVRATETILFGYPRLEAYSQQGAPFFGNVVVAPLSYPAAMAKNYDRGVYHVTESAIPALLPKRDEYVEKRGQGTALVISGSSNMTGAACLCTEAALRSGVGLVTLAVPKSILRVLQTKLVEPVFCGLGDENCEFICESHVQTLLSLAQRNGAVAIGPGLGCSVETQNAVRRFLTLYEGPVVVDADAINACNLSFFEQRNNKTPFVITPHRREWERNFEPLPPCECDYPDYLKKYSTRLNLVIVLKGAVTYIALPNGCVYVAAAQNSGMAKGGSGDVLTGVIASFLAQGLNIERAALLGVLVHQKAGRVTREQLGAFKMLPSDVIRNLF